MNQFDGSLLSFKKKKTKPKEIKEKEVSLTLSSAPRVGMEMSSKCSYWSYSSERQRLSGTCIVRLALHIGAVLSISGLVT